MDTRGRAQQEVEQAITDSIREDRIVHLTSAPEITAALVMECEDYACLGGGGETEYWGTDDGAAWRVHVA